MAFDPLFFLPPVLRQALPIIRGAAAQGFTVDQIQSLVELEGTRIVRRELAALVQGLNAERGAALDLSRLRRDFHINPLRLPESVTKLRRTFSFVVELRGVNPSTSQIVSKFVTVSTNEVLSREDIEAYAEDAVSEEGEGYNFEVQETILREGKRAGREGLL